ncbi:MAG: hypothetical protein JW715_12155 [Sedimentisphaerales bacterium]|nr:hypothetical protein [Sedimentisphaerales bacterium]
MKKIFMIIFVMVFAATSFAAPGKIVKSGKCKLYEAGISDQEKIFTLDLKNEDIQALCRFRGKTSPSSGRFRLIGVPKITNLSGKALNISYNAAFFDEEGNLAASICQNSTLKPDAKELQLASALTYLPQSEFDKISSYKLVIYIMENPDNG